MPPTYRLVRVVDVMSVTQRFSDNHALAMQDSGRDAALDSLSAIVRGMASGHVRRYLEAQEAHWEVIQVLLAVMLFKSSCGFRASSALWACPS